MRCQSIYLIDLVLVSGSVNDSSCLQNDAMLVRIMHTCDASSVGIHDEEQDESKYLSTEKCAN
jgi:hypothetical protein